MAKLDMFVVDAFSDRLFGGNPAAVCPLEAWLPDELLASIAAENNLSETAFVVPEGDDFAIRWLTPKVEVDLCGHATLASGFVILRLLEPDRRRVRFRSRERGVLSVERDGERLTLDFPALVATERSIDPAVAAALSEHHPTAMYQAPGGRLMVVYDDARQVLDLAPDFAALSRVAGQVIATAPGREPGEDFVSRFFAPAAGIDEDPATGSAHCVLTPYWSSRLAKKALVARQLSARGATLWCELRDDRVSIAGHATLYLRGSIEL
jgi:PhzF family phenazine biosynthesis protein